jgi:uncharacterized protein YegL
MSLINKNKIKTSKRVKTIFYLLDTSGSMNNDGKIGALNQAMRDSINELKSKESLNTAATIKIAVMVFNTYSFWLYDNPIEVSKFPDWKDIEAGGVTDLGDALIKVNEKLNNEEGGFMAEKNSCFTPAFVLISDGQPTDDWENALNIIKNNKWFKHSDKIALAVGDCAQDEECIKVLKSFTESNDGIIRVDIADSLMKMIKFVTMVFSEGGSKTDIINQLNLDYNSQPKDVTDNF